MSAPTRRKGYDPATVSILKEKMPVWRADARAFVREVFFENEELDIWQEDTLKAVSDPANRRLCLKACKGVGKTASLAWIALWGLFCFENMQVVCLAITEDNLTDGLWKEIHFWAHKTPLSKMLFGGAFDFGKTRVCHVDPSRSETWFISARSYPKAATPEDCGKAVYGLHAENMMILLDESGGMPDAIMDAAEGILFNAGGCKHIVQAGNPSHRSGPLWNACRKNPEQWWIKSITADPDRADRCKRVPVEVAREYIAKFPDGRNADQVKVAILGEFPDQDATGMFDEDVLKSAGLYYMPEQAYADMPRILGVDVARQGADRTVLFPRQGRVAFTPKILFNGANTLEVVAAIKRACDVWEPDAINVDGTGGYGGGVIDILRSEGYPVHEILFNESKFTDNRFVNRRAEMYYKLAQWFKNPVACYMDDVLVEEMMATTFKHKGDKLMMESKDTIRALIGRSPDLADALALTFAVEPSMRAKPKSRTNCVRAEPRLD